MDHEPKMYKMSFYLVWGAQLLSILVVFTMAIVNILMIFKGHGEAALLALIFGIMSYRFATNKTSGFKALRKDLRAFKEDQNFIWRYPINDRYSLRKKKKIPEKIVRRRLKTFGVKIWPH